MNAFEEICKGIIEHFEEIAEALKPFKKRRKK